MSEGRKARLKTVSDRPPNGQEKVRRTLDTQNRDISIKDRGHWDKL